MELVCVSNRLLSSANASLTVGKVYTVFFSESTFLVFNDFKKWKKYDYDLFEPINGETWMVTT